ncbi:MAG: tetratricopeptide repeat protein [Rhodothermales bacterium]|nr:tetratricopeptide repeat protein [Rhodothermales bacterium]
MKKGVVFYETSGVANAYMSVLRAASEAGYVPILKEADALRDRPTLHAAHAAGIPCIDWHAFASLPLRERAAVESTRRVNALLTLMKIAEVAPGAASTDGGLLHEVGQPFFRSLLRRLEQQVLAIDTLKRVLHAYDVRLIVVGDDHSDASRAVVHFAREAQVPTLALGEWWYGSGLEAVAEPALFADFAAVGSRLDRDRLVAAGVASDQVFVTGWPGKAEPGAGGNEQRTQKHEARLRLGMPPDRPVILLRVPPFEGVSADFARRFRFSMALHIAALQATRAVQGGCQLIVEPAAEDEALLVAAGADVAGLGKHYEKWLDEEGYGDVYLVRCSNGDAVRAADMVVCLESSHAVVESMLRRRPVIAVTMDPEAALAHEGLVGPLVVRRLPDLTAAIESLLADPGRARAVVQRQNQHLADVNHSADGLAAERLARLVLALCRQGASLDAHAWDEPMPDIIAACAAMKTAEQERLVEGVRAVRRLRTAQPAEAEALVRELARVFPRHAQPVWELYDILTMAGRTEESARLLERFSASFDETHAPLTVLVRLGLIRLRAGNREAALNAFEQARLQAPYEPAVLTSLGKLYMDTGRHAEALDLLRDATGRLPEDPDIWLALAHAARQLDDHETFKKASETYHLLADKPATPEME